MSNERNHRVRFCDNNFLENDLNSIVNSTSLTGFPFEYASNSIRGLYWIPRGNFHITLNNNDKIYIDDGALKTITIDADEYTGTELALEIQTELNVLSSGWTCTYSNTTYKFTISHGTATHELIISNQLESMWNDIGFTGLIDLDLSIARLSDEIRIHNYEYVTFDVGYNADGLFFALIGPKGSPFGFSQNAVITIQGNSINDFSAPPFSVEADYSDEGIYKFFDDQTTYSYRYWRILIDDKTNPNGPNALNISHLFLGNYTTFTTRNLNQVFSLNYLDQSNVQSSINGGRFFNERPLIRSVTGSGLDLMSNDQVKEIKNLIKRLGITRSFYFSADPTLCITDEIKDLTFYANFDGQFIFEHVFNQYFNFRFNIIEAN